MRSFTEPFYGLIRPGDILVFRDWNWAKHGKINAVVLPEDPRPLVKELSLDDDQQPVLVSFNDDFAPIPAKGATFCGYLVGIIGDSIRIGPILSGIGHNDIVRELQSRLP